MQSAADFVARAAVLLFGLFAVLWSAWLLPVAWKEAAVNGLADRILAMQVFSPDAISDAVGVAERFRQAHVLTPRALRSVEIIQLMVAEQAFYGGRSGDVDRGLQTLEHDVDNVIQNSPTDSFSWLLKFWVSNIRDGFKPDNFRFLRMSYLLGPNEGWIALKRLRFSSAVFSSLPADIKADVVREFVGLINSQLYSEAANILTGPAWGIRSQLLSALAPLPESTGIFLH